VCEVALQNTEGGDELSFFNKIIIIITERIETKPGEYSVEK